MEFSKKISEKLGLDANYFANNGFWMSLRYLMATVLGIAAGMAFSRFVEKEVYGNYQLILSFVATIAFTSMPELNKAIWSSTTVNMDGDLDTALNKKIKYSLIGSLILVLLAIKYYIGGDTWISLGIFIAAGAYPLSSGGDIWSHFLDSKKEYKLSTTLSVLFSIFNKLILIGAAFLYPAAACILVAANLLPIAITNFLGIKMAYKKKKNNDKDKKFTKYGWFLVKMGVMRDILLKIDNLIIGIFVGPAELAVYSFASIIPDQVTSFISSLGSITVPKIGEQKDADIKRKIKEKSLLILLMGIGLIGATIVLTPFVIHILFTDKYMESVGYSQIITASLIFYAFEVIYSKIFLIKKYTNALIIMNTVIPIFRVCAIVAGFLMFGISGIVWSNLLTRFFNFICYIYLSKRNTVCKIQ